MAENDIIVAKEGSGGTLSEIALAPSDIGAANASHTHTAADIDSGASASGTFLQSNGVGGAGWNNVSYADLEDVPINFTPAAHTHAAADVTSGTFDNARINFAAPAAIGSTTPAAGTFTTLAASSLISSGNVVSDSNLRMRSNTGQISLGSANDVLLYRGTTASVLELRNSTSAQTFNIYNTYTSSTNYERGFLKWSSNVLQIGTEKDGTGSARNLELLVGGVVAMRFQPNTQFDLVGTLRPQTNNVYSLGLNTRRWTNIFLTTSLFFGDSTSATDPQIKKSGTTLQVRLADDSAFTAIQAGNLILTDNTGDETATFDAQSNLTGNRTYTLTDRSGAMVLSDTSVATGADAVTNIVSLTTAEYNAIGSPDAATLYLITDP